MPNPGRRRPNRQPQFAWRRPVAKGTPSAGHRALPLGTGERPLSLCLNWPGWSRACWRRATEDRCPPGACSRLEGSGRATQQPCQRWQRGRSAGHKLTEWARHFFDAIAGPANGSTRFPTVELLLRDGVRRPGGARRRHGGSHSACQALSPGAGPAPVRPRPRPRSGPPRGSSRVTSRCEPRGGRGAGGWTSTLDQ